VWSGSGLADDGLDFPSDIGFEVTACVHMIRTRGTFQLATSKSDDDAGFGVVLNVEMELLNNTSAVRVVLPAEINRVESLTVGREQPVENIVDEPFACVGLV
jgi:hypothetical protein